MAIVRVKEKFQITVPAHLRTQLVLKVGDILEAEVKNGVLAFAPKTLIDRELARGRADIKAGRFIGPFSSAQKVAKALNRSVPSRTKRSR
ncbi:hypothetical protein A3C91_04120 [Candidatus Azambacteria bacterium RIFCSPHIGHO2_02_FULL_52_12]|uniref:SpoVT-AbrB domain-containing protein n=1 Tax=Candidatus Azambacteria bacterium RIFCSPLOWO2_01_FULL_46_25 TaxID=1797298 RepID=A0A1F5BUY5_9BACT|nr:MAG: hypothetical protein A3C91_04120 [Candidatus Azambacteria bacterium RIFCSPHIGHO2_02_FULL_52_12]OGD34429.1 MAG: hypothetical protein A2988_02805 [Candidatus Azambacteria bacterium RIFCSPLOWO2_01_FULL_46_25]OGD37293.1 MAG: hypothetical protein A2850_01085 [Candidatus Azambacteria bacterium RIFCSPHIGHO2_01_FULL_51_74]